jgi:hypothetical protein
MIAFHVDAKEGIEALKAQYKSLSKQEVYRAVALSFNAQMGKNKTALRRHLQAKYPQTALRVSGYNQGKGITMKKATRSSLYAVMYVASKPIALIHFGAKDTESGVSVEVTKGKRKTLPFAFIAKGRYPTKNVLGKSPQGGRAYKDGQFMNRTKRVNSKPHDLPIAKLVGPKVGQPDSQFFEELKRKSESELPGRMQTFFDKIYTGKLH